MLKIKRVYICDKCGKVALPKVVEQTNSDWVIITKRILPNGWSRPFGFNKHLCPECTRDLYVYLEFKKKNKEEE